MYKRIASNKHGFDAIQAHSTVKYQGLVLFLPEQSPAQQSAVPVPTASQKLILQRFERELVRSTQQ